MSKFLVILIAITFVSACSNFKQKIGLIKEAPDEFTVMTRAPLTLPPNFDLVPPKDGNDYTTDTNKIAIEALKESSDNQDINSDESYEPSDGEILLLQKTKAVEANNDIRKIINKERANLTEDDGLIKIDETQVIVDSQKEAKRIETNLENGKAINDGDVPVINENQRKGFLEDIF